MITKDPSLSRTKTVLISAAILTFATLGSAASAAAQPGGLHSGYRLPSSAAGRDQTAAAADTAPNPAGLAAHLPAGGPPTVPRSTPKRGCVSHAGLQLPPAAESDPTTGLVVAAALGPHNSLNVYWQKPNTDWVGPHALDNGAQNIAYSSPTLGYDPQGYPFLAVVGPSNTLDVYWQNSGNHTDWHGPLQIGASGVAFSAPVIGKDAAGEPLIMVQGPSNTLYGFWEDSSNQWLGPYALGGGRQSLAYSASSVGTNGSSQPVVATDGPNDSLYVYWQEQSGYWDGPLGLDNGKAGIAYSAAALAVSPDGLPTVVADGPSNSLYVYWQTTANGTWTGPLGIDNGDPNIAFSAPSFAYSGQMGRLEALAVGKANSLYTYWQTVAHGPWLGPAALDNSQTGIAYSTPAEGVNARTGAAFALDIGPANSLYFYWQQSNGYWQGPLGIDNGDCGIAY
jgi:hypothetical protein